MTSNQLGGVNKDMALMKKREKIKDFRRSKLSDIVVDHIIESIKDVAFLPGQKIDPNEVASQLDISVMPVRDALERLEQQGWIVRYAKKGTYIRKIKLSKIRDTAQIRSMIESEAIIRLIENGTEGQLDQLKEIVDLNEQAVATNNLEVYEKTDTKFHEKLVELTENKTLMNMHEEILSQLRYMFFIIIWSSEKVKKHDIMNLAKIPISHRSVYEAIKARDLILALRSLREHLTKGVARYHEIIKIRNLYESGFFEE